MDPETIRKKGSALLKDGVYLEAVANFTKSIALATDESSKGLGYAARSAALQATGHFIQAIEDARRALTHNYPEILRYQLHLRTAECWKALGRVSESDESLCEAQRSIRDGPLSEKKKQELLEAVREEKKDPRSAPGLSVRYLKAPPLSHGARTDNERLSNAVEVKNDSKFGRHLIAARDINTGDVLVVEDPVISFLIETENLEKGNKEAIWTHCSHCYKMCLTLEPCKSCKWALYCSTECEESAWRGYHKDECRMRRKYDALKAPSDPDSTSSWVRIMLKVLSTFPDPKISEALSLLPDVFPDEKMERVGKLAQTLCRVCCEDCEEQQRLAGVCVRALLVFQRNSYTIDESHVVPSADAFRLRQVIGRGLYPTVALINHSCDANVTRVFHLGTQVVKAIRPIKKGQQIFGSYGPDYGGMPRSRRQAILREKFYFECDCDPCQSNWPLIATTMGYVPEFLRKPSILPLLREVVQKVIVGKTIQGRNYSAIINEEILNKCLALQKLYFEAGESRVDWIYFFTEKFIVSNFDLSAKIWVANKGEMGDSYLSAFNEETIFQAD
ncbi:SET and MYND domain-containing protein 4-like [Neocloeon triangulifer]|uniref:SET and MYND domain-containing protein 4-like n=1 Tax=Neocloeon triangulifer TaxID=2078957 RepID=UPI00286F363B|nr:SET and MYND domain-containing protein 4-like [Neocloeon triangulifer]